MSRSPIHSMIVVLVINPWSLLFRLFLPLLFERDHLEKVVNSYRLKPYHIGFPSGGGNINENHFETGYGFSGA